MDVFLNTVSLVFIAIVSSGLTFLWQRKNANEKSKQEYKETRYKCLVLLMKALIQFEKYQPILWNNGHKISTKEELVDLLQDEKLSAVLYASAEFIKSMNNFITKPNQETLVLTVLEMRKDLWGLKGKLNVNDI